MEEAILVLHAVILNWTKSQKKTFDAPEVGRLITQIID